MPEAPLRPRPEPLPRPPMPTRERNQLEAFLTLRRNPLELWGERAYELDVLSGRFLLREQVMLNAPDAIRHVLVANHENYGRSLGARRVLQPVLGAGLFLAEGAAWRYQRRTIAPALAPRTMPILARHVVAACETAEDELDGLAGKPVELITHLQHLALGIAGQSMFSLEMAGIGGELRDLLLRFRTARGEGITFATLPYSTIDGRRDGQSVVLLDPPAVDALFASLREDVPPDPAEPAAPAAPLIVAAEDVRVRVLDASGVPGLGRPFG